MNQFPNRQPKVEIAKKFLDLITTQVNLESQVTVHIGLKIGQQAQQVRICANTFLQCANTKIKYKMLFSNNISIYPKWTILEANSYIEFNLIFENLPKDCSSFHLIEDIPEEGGFNFENIEKNSSNIYYLNLN